MITAHFLFNINIKRKKKRNVLSRFRMSCHHLSIESGRHARPIISHDDRLCTSCSVLGDERHYLLYCKQLMDVRINLFGEAALSDIWMNEIFNSTNELLLNKLSLFIDFINST